MVERPEKRVFMAKRISITKAIEMIRTNIKSVSTATIDDLLIASMNDSRITGEDFTKMVVELEIRNYR
jgi:hypothetical protein